MRTILLVFLLALTFTACNVSYEKTEPFDLEETTTKVDSLLNTWHRAAAAADLETYIGIMDSNSIYIGTDASEHWTREAFETFCAPYFAKKKTWDFTPLERHIYFSDHNKVAWFDELLKTHMGTCRGSGTLENIHGNWKIKHYVLSLTIPNDDIEAVKKAKQKNDDAFLATFD